MARVHVGGIAFDMYGTLVDVGAMAQVCKEVAPDPVAFSAQWRTKQLEYTFLRTLLGRYEDFWKVTEDALEFAIRRFALPVTPEQRRRLMDSWLHPTPYPEVGDALRRLGEKRLLAVLSNGTPKMLQAGLTNAGLRRHFHLVLSAHSIKGYKPTPQVYRLAPRRMGLPKHGILFVSSNSFDVVGAKSVGFRVCWINRTQAPLDCLGLRPDLVFEDLEALATTMS